EFDDAIEGALADGPATGIGNGDFSDPAGGPWRTVGSVSLDGGEALLSPSTNGFLSSVLQVFLRPGAANALRFDVTGGFGSTPDGQAPSVFEVALLGAGYADALGGSARAGSDALISWTDGGALWM